jgi:hypothetical protein
MRHRACGADHPGRRGRPRRRPGASGQVPYCQAFLGRIRELWSDVRALANEPVRAPRGLLDEVIARVSGPAGAVTLRDATRGHTQVSEAVVAGVARQIAQAMPAVAFASVLAHAAGPGAVALRVRLVVAYGPSLPALAAAVREQIVTHVRRLTDVQLPSSMCRSTTSPLRTPRPTRLRRTFPRRRGLML